MKNLDLEHLKKGVPYYVYYDLDAHNIELQVVVGKLGHLMIASLLGIFGFILTVVRNYLFVHAENTQHTWNINLNVCWS